MKKILLIILTLFLSFTYINNINSVQVKSINVYAYNDSINCGEINMRTITTRLLSEVKNSEMRKSLLFATKNDLLNFVNRNQGIIDFKYDTAQYQSGSISLQKALENYDVSFFKDNYLALYLTQTGSSAKYVIKDSKVENYTLIIAVANETRFVTADIAYKFIIAEIPKSKYSITGVLFSH